jgi:hypothetical protein
MKTIRTTSYYLSVNVILFCTLIFGTVNLFADELAEKNETVKNAQNEKSQSDKKDESSQTGAKKNEATVDNQRTFPYYFLEGWGNFGATYPAGTISGNGSEKRKFDIGYDIGISFGRKWSDLLGCMVGFEYLRETMSINRSFCNSPMTYSVDLAYCNLLIGYSGSWRFLWFDAGYFYGIMVGSGKIHSDCNGVKSNESVSAGAQCNIHGIYYGAGVRFEINDSLFLKCGFRNEQSLTSATIGEDKLSPYFFTIQAAAEYRIAL